MNEVMTEPEAAEFLKRGLSTVRALRRAKQIPHLPGKPARYLRSSLLEWEKSMEVQPISASAEPALAKTSPRSTTYQRNPDKSALRAGILG